MRALIQRVSTATVTVNDQTISSIGPGLLIFLGIESKDDSTDIEWLTGKITNMRIFPDEQGKMNHSALDIHGEILVISQFTLHASTKKGNRPSFLTAAPPEISEPLYNQFCQKMSHAIGKKISQGIFGADMQVTLTNDGPITIWIDSKNRT